MKMPLLLSIPGLWLYGPPAAVSQSLATAPVVTLVSGHKLAGPIRFQSARFVNGKGNVDIPDPVDWVVFRAEGSSVDVKVPTRDIRTLLIEYSERPSDGGVAYITRNATIKLSDGRIVRGTLPTGVEREYEQAEFTRYVLIETGPLAWHRFQLSDFVSEHFPRQAPAEQVAIITFAVTKVIERPVLADSAARRVLAIRREGGMVQLTATSHECYGSTRDMVYCIYFDVAAHQVDRAVMAQLGGAPLEYFDTEQLLERVGMVLLESGMTMEEAGAFLARTYERVGIALRRYAAGAGQ